MQQCLLFIYTGTIEKECLNLQVILTLSIFISLSLTQLTMYSDKLLYYYDLLGKLITVIDVH